ncbi:hypothetical protein [Treponema sp. R80B11-R83G3]
MNILKEKIKKSKCFLFYKKINNTILKLKYIIIGKFLGIDISLVSYNQNENSDYIQYQPAYTWYIKKIMKLFSINQSDKLLDYGSGKGAAMIFFARYSFIEIGGVEYNKNLHETAINNFKKIKLNYLKSYNYDAALFADIDQYTYFFMYNPFIGNILELTIEQIKQSLIRNPRKITILYQNPIGHDLFVNSKLFPYIKSCFIPSLLNLNKKNKRYGRQFINIYCTEILNINFSKYGIILIDNV